MAIAHLTDHSMCEQVRMAIAAGVMLKGLHRACDRCLLLCELLSCVKPINAA
jgi:hypothetical protein